MHCTWGKNELRLKQQTARKKFLANPMAGPLVLGLHRFQILSILQVPSTAVYLFISTDTDTWKRYRMGGKINFVFVIFKLAWPL